MPDLNKVFTSFVEFILVCDIVAVLTCVCDIASISIYDVTKSSCYIPVKGQAHNGVGKRHI